MKKLLSFAVIAVSLHLTIGEAQSLGGGLTPSAYQTIDGVAAAPSYSWASEPTSGFFRFASQNTQYSVNGSGIIGFGSSGPGGSAALALSSVTSLGWVSTNPITGSVTDTVLAREAAGTLAQRNLTNAQTFRIYNTFTDASNYERGIFSWTGSALNIGTEAAGTGTSRSMVLGANIVKIRPTALSSSTGEMQVTNNGNVIWTSDNTSDIGASGATRPRTMYAGTSVVTPGVFGIASGNLNLGTNASTTALTIQNSGAHFIPGFDNLQDFGSGAARLRTVYAGTSVITPAITAATANLSLNASTTSPTGGLIVLSNSGTGATQLKTSQTTAPTCTSNCGTSPSVAGSDINGRITMGGTGVPASGFVVTFNGTWASAPQCNVWMSKAAMATGKKPIVVVTATTTFTVTTDGVAPSNSDTYDYHCLGN